MSNQVLATVNQIEIQLRDLMPVGPDETEIELAPSQYDSRLQRAIEMELIFQAARERGVGLTTAQYERLGQTSSRHQLELEHYRQYGLLWSSIGEAQVAFGQRLLVGQMLEQNLVVATTGTSPSSDPVRQSRYEQARRDFLDQLHANSTIAMDASLR